MQKRRSRLTGHRRGRRLRNVICLHAQLCGALWIDFESDCRATHDLAVLGIYHAFDFLNRRFDFISFVLEGRGIFAEQLDFDGLRISFEIANHVRQDADEFNL
ncbi:MAG: hypothetical protein DMF70_16485 [Acidobacteria bacterium]|nr:MAG: hypothetical protein DMF70_16485 [Acidobacteriota bacterium]